MRKGRIHSIETFAAVDGPGLRVAVFLQGCPQRCIYCHNPDTWDVAGGEEMTAEELMKKIVRYKPYFRKKGGVTVSGGEPFLQAEFVGDLFERLRAEGIHTAADTCGYYLTPAVKSALAHTDLVLLDIKHTDASLFETITKKPISHTIEFLDYMKEVQKPLWIRQVILPGYTDNEVQIHALMDLLQGANVERIDLLAYHTLGVDKWKELGIPYPIPDLKPPAPERVAKLQAIANAALKKQKKEL